MDAAKKIRIAFIWHMHQPFYKDPSTGTYLMPWVRLHGVKDYLPMAALLEKFENVKATFNLVPSLIEQITDYVQNDARDIFLDLTMRKASALTLDEKTQILENFFRVNFKHFISPSARYSELLIKKGVKDTPAFLKKAARDFSDRDYLDLQVLFNLSWFHSISLDDDVNLKDLIAKKESYSEEDKEYIVFKQRDILARILPLYKRLQDEGRIEITTTPYYHPIVPLLCDTSVAKVSLPGVNLPQKRFSHPEDARWHIAEAIKCCTTQFGRSPRGMWPSEGSVSDETLDLMSSCGVEWVATDEDILFNTLTRHDTRYQGPGAPLDRRLIYRPYTLKKDSRKITLVFRDKNLSDMISFAYNSWDQAAAAGDLLGHFKRISDNLRRDVDTGLLTIVMDGENAWEHYADNGRRFFETLYAGLAGENDAYGSTTVSDYLASESPRKVIADIFPGSWIDHNFAIWIGEEQDNLSWDYLYKVRSDLVRFTREFHKSGKAGGEEIQKAWRALYRAEGSDWNWWYGGAARSGGNNPFDRLYRMHLASVYNLLKKPVPDFLKISIA